jgi:hypothetical protein
MIDDDECGATGGMSGREKEVEGENLPTVPIDLPQISQ